MLHIGFKLNAQEYLNKLLIECNNNPYEFENKFIDSLTRLTKHYKKKQVKKILSEAVLGNIFIYIFTPDYPSKNVPSGWLALTPNQTNHMIDHIKDKIAINLGGFYVVIDIDSLWVNKLEVISNNWF